MDIQTFSEGWYLSTTLRGYCSSFLRAIAFNTFSAPSTLPFDSNLQFQTIKDISVTKTKYSWWNSNYRFKPHFENLTDQNALVLRIIKNAKEFEFSLLENEQENL